MAKSCVSRIAIAIAGLMISASVQAEESYSPYAGATHPQNVYFGDTHLHTGLSTDAYMRGNRKLDRDSAYKLAKGGTITADNGMKVKLRRPLDFLVIADHAEGIGVMKGLFEADPDLLKTKVGRQMYKAFKADEKKTGGTLSRDMYWKVKAIKFEDHSFTARIWDHVTASADKNNEPGKFTAFIGYEWTRSAIDHPQHLHRVVIFKDDKEKARQVLPFSQIDSVYPEDLWAYLQGYQEKTGGEILAVPHNPNLSGGLMFRPLNSKGEPIDAAYAASRARWEPLLEVTQIKGDSETHPLVSPADEFADYETWPAKKYRTKEWEQVAKYEYARSALKLGLGHKATVGVNPFKFGMIGSTDAHTSMSAIDDNNYWGKFPPEEPSATRPTDYLKEGAAPWNAAGYAAVWANENTRESLFEAMKRRETYATTGPRMTVRFFGGWGFDKGDANRPDLSKTGYDKGVPMGGDLASAPKGKAPSFLIRAVKDPDGANLDRVQVVKGWRSADGELHEKIYNVALSDGRKDKGQKTKRVGSTVNVKDASYTNTIGEAELATVWADPDFKADELAFYYVRVLEIPTPRWTAYDAKYFDIKDIPDEVEMITQERAYTSPIWYTP